MMIDRSRLSGNTTLLQRPEPHRLYTIQFPTRCKSGKICLLCILDITVNKGTFDKDDFVLKESDDNLGDVG